MKAVVYDAPRSFAVRDVPVPKPGPGELLIRVLASGVCGTDLHLHEGQFMAAWPMTPGHETIGHVVALGAGVTGFAVGQFVAVNPNRSCGGCAYCREGRPLLCVALTGAGTTRPGGFAELLKVPADDVFDVEGLDPDVAVFTEPLACVVHGVDRARVMPGASALVIGAGPTGLLLAQLLARAGAASVTSADIAAFKLRTAEALGVDRTLLMDRNDLAGDVARLRALAGPGADGYDLVVDATGIGAVGEACPSLARNGGTILLYGVADERDRIRISPYEVFRRELTILGSMAEIDTFPNAIALLRSGRVRTDGIISHRFGLEDYGTALDTLRHDPTAHKLVIQPA
ncbi:MAG: zinc-dependent alcohol dehydrogenase family protein [Chloroflexota bacterium]